MSAVATAWAWRQAVKQPSRKLLLLKLADQSDDDGRCSPSMRTLSVETGLSKGAVERAVGDLADVGLLTVERRQDDHGVTCSNRYALQIGSNSGVPPRWDTRGTPLFEPNAFSNTADRAVSEAPVSTRGTRTSPSQDPSLFALPLFDDLALGEEEGPREGKNRRRRDLAFEALCEATGFTAAAARGQLNQALSVIRKVHALEEPDADDARVAEQIRLRTEVLRRDWDGKAVSPSALARWWRPAGVILAHTDEVLDTLGELPEGYDPEPEATKRFQELQELRRPSGGA